MVTVAVYSQQRKQRPTTTCSSSQVQIQVQVRSGQARQSKGGKNWPSRVCASRVNGRAIAKDSKYNGNNAWAVSGESNV